MNETPEILTVKEAAAALRCALGTIYHLFAAGELAGFRVGARGVRVYAASIEDYKRRRANQPAPVPAEGSDGAGLAELPQRRQQADNFADYYVKWLERANRLGRQEQARRAGRSG